MHENLVIFDCYKFLMGFWFHSACFSKMPRTFTGLELNHLLKQHSWKCCKKI